MIYSTLHASIYHARRQQDAGRRHPLGTCSAGEGLGENPCTPRGRAAHRMRGGIYIFKRYYYQKPPHDYCIYLSVGDCKSLSMFV